MVALYWFGIYFCSEISGSLLQVLQSECLSRRFESATGKSNFVLPDERHSREVFMWPTDICP